MLIIHPPKSLLFDYDDVWLKKENPNFDLTMGSYDGAELCKFTGLYILSVLNSEFGKEEIGLYRDNSLSCFSKIKVLKRRGLKRKK